MIKGTKVQINKPGCDFNGCVGTVLYIDENCGNKIRVEFSGARRPTERKHYWPSELEVRG